MGKSLIIIQAPADIPYALDILLKNANRYCYIVVVNVQKVFLFLNSLCLDNCHIIFIPYPNFNYSLLFNLKKSKNYFRSVYDINIHSLLNNVDNVFFFSRFEDPLTSFFIHKIIKDYPNMDIFYENHYDNFETCKIRRLSIRQFKHYLVCCLVSNMIYNLGIEGKIPEFRVYKYKNIKEVHPTYNADITRKFLVRYDFNKSVLLLFNVTCSGLMSEEMYSRALSSTIAQLKESGFFVVSKGHPREGLHSILEKMSDFIIPDYIPAEFLDLNAFNIIIGLDSTAIAKASLIMPGKVFSMLNVFSCISSSFISDYLVKESQGCLLFPSKMEEVVNIYE